MNTRQREQTKQVLESLNDAKNHLRLIDEELAALTGQHAALQLLDEHKEYSSTAYSPPASLIECNLVAGIKELIEALPHPGTLVTFDVFGKAYNVGFHPGVFIYRSLFEITDCIVSHTMATHLLIHLSFFDNSIELYIEDDGIALNLADANFAAVCERLQTKINLMEGIFKSDSNTISGNVFKLIIPSK